MSKRISTDESLFVAVGKWAALHGPRIERGVTARQFTHDFVAVNLLQIPLPNYTYHLNYKHRLLSSDGKIKYRFAPF